LAAFTPGEFAALVLEGRAMENGDYCIVTRECPFDYTDYLAKREAK
jgi:hypothetical protein